MGSSAKSKCDAILSDGGIEIPKPDKFKPNLICVVDNGMFGAAAYAYCDREFNDFNVSTDRRPKRWFVWEKADQFAL